MCYHGWLLRPGATNEYIGTRTKGNALFGIGGFELFLILLFGFLLFGPDKLPAMAKTLGKAIRKFQSAQEEMNKVIKNEVYDPDSDEPFKNPLDAMDKAAKAGKAAADKVDKAASKATHSSPSAAASQQPRTQAKQESFTERKARYDRERAAKQAADAERAEKAKQEALAAADAAKNEAQPTAAAKPAEAAPAASAAAAPATAAPAATSATDETKGE